LDLASYNKFVDYGNTASDVCQDTALECSTWRS